MADRWIKFSANNKMRTVFATSYATKKLLNRWNSKNQCHWDHKKRGDYSRILISLYNLYRCSKCSNKILMHLLCSSCWYNFSNRCNLFRICLQIITRIQVISAQQQKQNLRSKVIVWYQQQVQSIMIHRSIILKAWQPLSFRIR